MARFIARGTNDGPVGPFSASGKKWTLPMCEMWHFDTAGRVVGGEIYYDQASLLTQLGRLPDTVRSLSDDVDDGAGPRKAWRRTVEDGPVVRSKGGAPTMPR